MKKNYFPKRKIIFFGFSYLGLLPFSKKNLLVDFFHLLQQDKLINKKKK